MPYIPHTEDDVASMLETIGADSIEQLISETIPSEIRINENLNLEPALSEYEFLNHIYELSQKNKIFKTYF